MGRPPRSTVKSATTGAYASKGATYTPVSPAKSSTNIGASRLESFILKADTTVKDALRLVDNDQKEIDALSVEIKETQTWRKAILDTF